MAGDIGGILADRYRLTGLLGQGGMGAVWRARDEQLDRDVAVKELRLPEHLGTAERENWIARLDREARAAARLKHPGIITVHDRVTGDDGRPWIVMELVQGGSLDDLLARQGPLPPHQVAHIGRQMAEALSVAHRMGITHRDIKPANILLEGDRVVLSDFGIAAVHGDVTLTGTGMLMGTPAFMAPEQVRGLPATAESDLWSLGATLYNAVEGHPPFDGASPSAVFVAVATEEPIAAKRAGPLEPLLSALFRKDPAQRLTMDQLNSMLAALTSYRPTAVDVRPAAVPVQPPLPPPPVGSPPVVPPPQPLASPAVLRRRRPVRTAVISVVALALVVGASIFGYSLYQKREDSAAYQANVRATKEMTDPTGFTRTNEEDGDADRARVTYEADGSCFAGCPTQMEAARTWLKYQHGMGAVGYVKSLTDCPKDWCVLPVKVSGYRKPTVHDAWVRAKNGRFYLRVDVGPLE